MSFKKDNNKGDNMRHMLNTKNLKRLKEYVNIERIANQFATNYSNILCYINYEGSNSRIIFSESLIMFINKEGTMSLTSRWLHKYPGTVESITSNGWVAELKTDDISVMVNALAETMSIFPLDIDKNNVKVKKKGKR